jgi:SAM-dependent methyltransferase
LTPGGSWNDSESGLLIKGGKCVTPVFNKFWYQWNQLLIGAGVNKAWSAGLKEELDFWDEWFRTRGSLWPQEYKRRLDPLEPLSSYHCGFINHLPQDKVRVLDVGAGPLTVLGKVHPSKELLIIATDALAREYNDLLNKYRIDPPVRTIFAKGERLTRIFSKNSFDLVYAQNTLDHSYDPLEAMRKMIKVAKEGCFVVLDHIENEADNENYRGLHQWNFAVRKGNFTIASRGIVIDVSRELSSLGDVVCSSENQWVRVHIRKKPR